MIPIVFPFSENNFLGAVPRPPNAASQRLVFFMGRFVGKQNGGVSC